MSAGRNLRTGSRLIAPLPLQEVTGTRDPDASINWDAVTTTTRPPAVVGGPDSGHRATAARATLRRLVEDLGRLSARTGGPLDSYSGFLCSRLAEHVERLDIAMNPTAAELYRHYRSLGYGEDVSVTTALDVVDRRVDRLRSITGADRWEDGY